MNIWVARSMLVYDLDWSVCSHWVQSAGSWIAVVPLNGKVGFALQWVG
jgi:hypothetical protein